MQNNRSLSPQLGPLAEAARIARAVRPVERPEHCKRPPRLGSAESTRLLPATAAERLIAAGTAGALADQMSIEPRPRHVHEVRSLLRRPDVRLITFTGEPEEDKSRLVEGVAAVLARELVYGVVLVDLARVRQDSAVGQAVAEALRVSKVAPVLLGELVEWMRGRQILLILDNVERLQDGGQSVARLLEECPRVRLLLTSPLEVQLEGEHRVAVGPEPQPAEQPVETDGEPGAAPPPMGVDGASGWCLQPGVAPDESKLSPLTAREREVAQLLALGLTNREIADELVITYRTAETHACRVLRKLGFSCRSLVVQWAIERGLVVFAASRQG